MRRGLTRSTRTGSGRFRLDASVIAAIIARRAAFGGALRGAAAIVGLTTWPIRAACLASSAAYSAAAAAAARLAGGTAVPITARLARSAACLVVGAEELIVPTLFGFLWPPLLCAPGRRPQATGSPSQVSQYAATHDSAEQPQSLATWDRAGNNP